MVSIDTCDGVSGNGRHGDKPFLHDQEKPIYSHLAIGVCGWKICLVLVVLVKDLDGGHGGHGGHDEVGDGSASLMNERSRHKRAGSGCSFGIFVL